MIYVVEALAIVVAAVLIGFGAVELLRAFGGDQ